MLREIVVPVNNTYLLHLPDEYIGKTVEVIAFEVDEKNTTAKLTAKNSMKDTLQFYDAIRIDLSGYKFDRDEANER